MKRIIVLILTAAMLLMSVPAMAGQGDRTVYHLDNNTESRNESIQSVFPGDNCIIALMYANNGSLVRVYPLDGGEPTEYMLENYNQEYSLLEMYEALNDEANPEEAEGEEGVNPEDGSADEPEEYLNTMTYFGWNGNIYALQYKYQYTETGNTIDGGYIKKVTLADGTCTLEDTTDIPRLDWSEMVQDYGDWTDTKYLDRVIAIGSTLVGSSWDNNGNATLEAFDLTTGFHHQLELDSEASVYMGSNDVLVADVEWGADSTAYHVKRIDIADGSEEPLCDFTLEHNYIYDMTVDMDKNTLYYIMDGEIWAAPDMEIDSATALCDCPSSGAMSFLPDGRMLIWDSSNILIRNIDPATRGTETRMIVQDFAYGDGLEEAIFDYNNKRGDVTIVLKRGGERSTILQDMMNREADADIYTLDYSSSEFAALLNRGYLPDLSGNADIAAMTERLYPYVKDALVKDGRIIGVPVAINGSTVSVNLKAWKEMGGTEEELPKTWGQFLDWLESLPSRLEGQKTTIFDTYYSDEDFIQQCMINILYQYEATLEAGGRDFSFSTPELQNILERLVNMDCEALGLKSQADFEEGYYDDGGEWVPPLVELYGRATIETWNDGYSPLLLSFAEGEEAVLPIDLTVAFVNPYSTHADIAAEYLSIASGKLWQAQRYSLFSDMTEPVRYSYYEEMKKQNEKFIEEAKQIREKLTDEQEIQEWDDRIKSYQDTLEELDKDSWSISPETISGYQSRTSSLRISAYNFINDMGKDEKSSDAFYDLISGFAKKTISVARLLQEIDSKVQMMRLEGN